MTEAISLNCEDALRLLADYLDGELARLDDAAVHHHLEHCRSCYSRAEFEKRLKAQMAALNTAPATPDLANRIRNLMNLFQKQEGEE